MYLCVWCVELDEEDMALMAEVSDDKSMTTASSSLKHDATTAASAAAAKDDEPLPDYEAVVAAADVDGQ